MNARNRYRAHYADRAGPEDNHFGRRQRLYRDTEHAWLAGVCAGLAEKHGLPRVVVRAIAVLLLFTPLNFAVVVAYLVAAFAIPRKPVDLYRSPEEETFWRSVNRAPADTFGALRHRFRELEHRLRRMEAYITSKEFELDRELGRDRR